MWKDVTCVIAVSGGADSVGLLRLLAALKKRHGGDGRLIVAHFNHRWRGDESDQDQDFVQTLAGQMKIQCVCGQAQQIETATDSPERDGRSEQAARHLRYEYLTNVAHEYGARFIATAHTLDDQVETVLHRILRGTGLRGLSGIPVYRSVSPSVSLVRPLLAVERTELEQFLNSTGQSFRLDSSNSDRRYTRNRIRHELLPTLKQDYNSEVALALLRLSHLAQRSQAEIQSQVERFAQESVTSRSNSKGADIEIDRLRLGELSSFMRAEVFMHLWRLESWPLQDYGFEQWDALARLCDDYSTERKTMTLPGSIRVAVEDRVVTLRKN